MLIEMSFTWESSHPPNVIKTVCGRLQRQLICKIYGDVNDYPTTYFIFTTSHIFSSNDSLYECAGAGVHPQASSCCLHSDQQLQFGRNLSKSHGHGRNNIKMTGSSTYLAERTGRCRFIINSHPLANGFGILENHRQWLGSHCCSSRHHLPPPTICHSHGLKL